MKSKNDVYYKLLESWSSKSTSITSYEDIRQWLDIIKNNTYVNVKETMINDDSFWFYDEINGEILNRKRSFFQIKGIQEYKDGSLILEQPIIIQPEIGYLGIICKEINGTIHFLMQAKIEPGNINRVQLSPTIQATKSNFMKMHGGDTPPYLEYFEKASNYTILYDQIQSEQGARFLHKRNRNMIILVEEEIEVLPSYKWMTIYQIKRLMRENNIVNMDTRTVISMLNMSLINIIKDDSSSVQSMFGDKSMYYSFFNDIKYDVFVKIYNYINNCKMFHSYKEKLVPLNELYTWAVNDKGVFCKNDYPFSVKYYDIEITGREVKSWTQPLFVADGEMVLALLTRVRDNVREFLIQVKHEVGYCDIVELAPSIQKESNDNKEDAVSSFVNKAIASGSDKIKVLTDVYLSEEGGRFYHEENRNLIIQIAGDDLEQLPEGYFWVEYNILGALLNINNCVNVQLRNLISLLYI